MTGDTPRSSSKPAGSPEAGSAAPIRRDPVSLADVAAKVGVSLATVSRVLSDAPYPVAKQTRARVLEAAEELGYTPNAIARALARRMTNTVGIIVGDITDPYFAEIARGAEDVARSHGHLSIVCNTDRNPGVELAYMKLLLEHYVAGIIVAGGFFPDATEAPAFAALAASSGSTQSRIVLLADRKIDVPTIYIDEKALMLELTQVLIGLGHRRIVFVNGLPGLSVSINRQAGFEQAMTEAGLDPTEQIRGGFGIEPGRNAALQLLRGKLPDAIIAASDEAALGLLTTLQQAGVRVPEQVSIAGVDDNRYARLANLTTVQVPAYEMGSMAALRILTNTADQPQRTLISGRIVQRGTTARRLADTAGGLRDAG
jgi:LacI family transcriptional regulator